MKKNYALSLLCLATSLMSSWPAAFSQKNKTSPWDTALQANSEKWKVVSHQKMFGEVSKVEFGPFSTITIEKLDSPVHKIKTKEGADLNVDLGYDAETDHGVDVDLTRKIITQKSKYYRMLLAASVDTVESLCSLISISKDEKQTVGGAALKTLLHGHYESEEGGGGMVGYLEVVNGFIVTPASGTLYKFYFTLGRGDNNNVPTSSFQSGSSSYLSGYLHNNDDSMQITPVISTVITKLFGKYDTLSFEEGFDLVNEKGEHLATYQLIGADKKSPYVWLHNDLNDSDRQAIASFLAIVIARKRYQNSKAVK